MDPFVALSQLAETIDDLDNIKGFFQYRLETVTPKLLSCLHEKYFPEELKPKMIWLKSALTGKEGKKFDQVIKEMNDQEVMEVIEKIRELYDDLIPYGHS